MIHGSERKKIEAAELSKLAPSSKKLSDEALNEAMRKGISHLRWCPTADKMAYTKMCLPAAGLINLEPLRNFKYIQRLEISDNLLTEFIDVSSLSFMPFLVSLDCSANRLSKTPEIQPAPYNLQDLDLSRNQIMIIGNMSGYPFLRHLCLDRNLIKRITGLETLKNLTHLSLRNNGISKMEGLSGLPLQFLDLRQNRIRCIENLETLVDLQELYLANNFIQTLRGLSNCVHLSKLDVEANDINSLDEFLHLRSLIWLRYLNCRKNPFDSPTPANVTTSSTTPKDQNSLQEQIANIPQKSYCTNLRNCHLLIIHLLSHLTILNKVPITPQLKVHAVNMFLPTEETATCFKHAESVQHELKQYARIRAIHHLAGPTGSGKRTLTKRLLEEYPLVFGLCVSHTSRPPRHGEENGVHYHFVSKESMLQMIEDGLFVEVVSFFGNYYGNSFESVYRVAVEGKVCIMDLELEGVLAMKKSPIQARYTCLIPPSIEVLHERLKLKANEEKQLKKEAELAHRREQNRIKKERQKVLVVKRVHTLSQVSEELVNDDIEKEDEEPLPEIEKEIEEEENSGNSATKNDAEDSVEKWVDKASADTTSKGDDKEDEHKTYGEYIRMEGFFDKVIVNDDKDRAYLELKDFVVKNYFEADASDDEDFEIDNETHLKDTHAESNL